MIEKKLELLRQTGIIDEADMAYVYGVWDQLKEVVGPRSQERYDIFLIHLAMAEARRHKGEALEGAMDDGTFHEIMSHPRFEMAEKIWKQVSNHQLFDLEELKFIYLHLLSVLEGEVYVS